MSSRMSASTIVYKGMLLVGQLRAFYADLQDERYESALAMVHSRFSTNTQPSWKRAHPNRMIAHNGEINTIRGNRGRMQARESVWDSPFLRENHEDVLPIVNAQGSDSAMLDNTLEFLYLNGMPIEKAVATLIPHPWQHASLPRKLKDFYHYHATLMEPWDGPPRCCSATASSWARRLTATGCAAALVADRRRSCHPVFRDRCAADRRRAYHP